jgi:hypothetical protein
MDPECLYLEMAIEGRNLVVKLKEAHDQGDIIVSEAWLPLAELRRALTEEDWLSFIDDNQQK